MHLFLINCLFRDDFSATTLWSNELLRFRVTISPHTGRFEINTEDGEGGLGLCASGRIQIVEDSPTAAAAASGKKEEELHSIVLERSDIYKEFSMRGYEYGPSFQGFSLCCKLRVLFNKRKTNSQILYKF
jgi:hypothetical protein